MRNSARVILLDQDKTKVLVIYRHKENKEYYTIPGGGIKTDESPERAARREIQEELGICLADEIKHLVTIKTKSTVDEFYWCITAENIPLTIRGEEKTQMTEQNIYVPQWIHIDSIQDIPLLPAGLGVIIKELQTANRG